MKSLVILVAVTCSSAQLASHYGSPGYYYSPSPYSPAPYSPAPYSPAPYPPAPYPPASPVMNPYGYFPGQYVHTPYTPNTTYVPPYMMNPYSYPYAHAPYPVPQYPYYPPPYALPHQPRARNTAAEQEEAEEAFGARNRRDLYAALPYFHTNPTVKDVATDAEQ